MSEASLHTSLKQIYARSIENQEIIVDGYLIDAIRDGVLIEIQTSNFSALKQKLSSLLPNHVILLVHPIPIEKWIVHVPSSGKQPLSRRKSPRRGRIEDIFRELVYITEFIQHPNFQIEIVFTREEEIRRADGLGSWRRKGVSIIDHHLIEVVGTQRISGKTDFRALLPGSMVPAFTVQDLANSLSIRRNLASKMIYCLRKTGVLQSCGKRGRAKLYTLKTATSSA